MGEKKDGVGDVMAIPLSLFARRKEAVGESRRHSEEKFDEGCLLERYCRIGGGSTGRKFRGVEERKNLKTERRGESIREGICGCHTSSQVGKAELTSSDAKRKTVGNQLRSGKKRWRAASVENMLGQEKTVPMQLIGSPLSKR